MSEPEKKPRRRIKKVKGHGGHHGGAWKVAYADFVTAMMALFLVLWLVSQADTKLKAAIANYFRNPGVFGSVAGGILEGAKKTTKDPASGTSKDDEQALFGVAEMLRKRFSASPGFSVYKEQVKIDVTDEGLRIQLVDKAERVSFPSGSATLTAEAQAVLAEIARGICELPNPIKIGGHTDKHLFPANSAYTNWELSADRANAARRVLEATCIKPEQIQRIIGFADTEPLLPDNPYAEANRRITIVVMRLQETGSIEPSSDEEKRRGRTPGSEKEDGDREAEKSRAQKKLSTEGTVSVGEPDQPPDNAIRTRESKRQKQ